MNAADFLPLATRLAAGATEPEWRTAESRAYYAAFHAARRLMTNLGFRVPRSDRAHAYLWLRLSNCGDAIVQGAAVELQNLRSRRTHADYDLQAPFPQRSAVADAQTASRLIGVFDAASYEPTRSTVIAPMRDYERNVLHDVTFQGP